MNSIKGISALFLASVLAAPVAVSADPGRDEAHGGYGNNCYEHKGKMKCRGGDDNGNGQRGRGNYQSAGGPPPWAPAHGWRRKQGGGHDHYDSHDDGYYVEEQGGVRAVVHGESATVDVGIERGTCNRKAIGTVVGGLIGGVIGNRAGDRNNRQITTVLGVVVGGIVGHNIGRAMDESDQHCTGQVLEQAPDNHTVRWADDTNNGEYRVTPERTYQTDGHYCRDFVTEYQSATGIERERSTACRSEDGAWRKMVM